MEKADNTVLIGKKSAMSYVLAVVTQFNNGAPEVAIKARGKAISNAVDVAEMVRDRFFPDASPTSISIGTDELVSSDGKKGRVSSIEITLSKEKGDAR